MLNPRNESNKLKYEGKVFSTKNNGDLVVIEYKRRNRVVVKFIDTGYVKTTHMHLILEGKVKDKLKPTVYGVGVVGDESCVENGVVLKEFKLWASMLQRCYDEELKKNYPSYKSCTTEPYFNSFANFKDWCSNQIGFGSKDENGKHFALDKDILIKGNKIYSPETCCFVPNEINNLLSPNKVNRGNTPIGVSFHKRDEKYQAYLSTGASRMYLGGFMSAEEAFYAYKQAKEDYIKQVADKWRNKIDPRVYEALVNYQIEITD